METRIYLIRHGETAWNRERRIQGHTDVPLSKEGSEQARRLGEYLKGVHFHAIYSSDLRRAVQTAEEVAAGRRDLQVHALPPLRERHLGEWEGLPFEEVKERYPDWQTVWNLGEKGEKYGLEPGENMRMRMMATLDRIAREHSGQQVAVVSHGGSINAVLGVISDGIYGPGRTRIMNTAVSILVHHRETGWRVEGVNQAEHLGSGGTEG